MAANPEDPQKVNKLDLPFDFNDPESCEAYGTKNFAKVTEGKATGDIGLLAVVNASLDFEQALRLRRGQLESDTDNQQLRNKVESLKMALELLPIIKETLRRDPNHYKDLVASFRP